ncbi:Thioesterase [Pedobacter cryoconitis]|uniref:Thioesterase n=1 Tax=Pedobacter cryoconitis TaxID=188932 RepID=A0A127VK24_9SPHI|nr:thioesterase domain-containing protein [Pedobacter cryoconitis]AMQ01640.1 Thioesterase [Pedobacter cryoconitis]
MKKIKLFCIPYAGGSATIYTKWNRHLSPSVELNAIELAGRGSRIQERLYQNISEAVEDIFKVISKDIGQSPYAIFGHSMGAMLSYKLVQRIRDAGYAEPLHIFFSGRGAPGIKRDDLKKYHLMNDEEFKEAIIKLGGTPPEFFEHPELMEMFLPLLKNDFKLSESDEIHADLRPFDQNLTVFLGKDEDLTAEQCNNWKKHTYKLCNIHYFNGGHFFLHNETKQITKIINNVLLNGCYE